MIVDYRGNEGKELISSYAMVGTTYINYQS